MIVYPHQIKKANLYRCTHYIVIDRVCFVLRSLALLQSCRAEAEVEGRSGVKGVSVAARAPHDGEYRQIVG